jgi:hypothetical protein
MPATHRPTSPAAPIAWSTTQRDRKASGAPPRNRAATGAAAPPARALPAASSRNSSRAMISAPRRDCLRPASSNRRSAEAVLCSINI